MLAGHRSRWRRFAVALCGSQVVIQVLDLFTGVALPTLRKLQISVQNDPSEPTYQISSRRAQETTVPALPFLQYTPHLVNLAFVNCPEFWGRWQHVHLQHKVGVLEVLQQDLPDELWDILATQVNLEGITLGAGTFDAQQFPRPPPGMIVLPKVRVLWLQREATKILEAYCQLLSVPKLSKLVLDRVKFPLLAPWFEALRPHLTALHLRNPTDLCSDDIAVIRILDQLQTFVIAGYQRVSSLLLDCLCEGGRDDGTGVMWPRLTMLKLFGVLFDETSVALLGKLVNMRRQPPPVDAKGVPLWAKLNITLSDPNKQGLTVVQIEEIKRQGSTVDPP